MKERASEALKELGKYKYVLLVVLVGMLLLLWPAGEAPAAADLTGRDGLEVRLEAALSQIEGVGEASVVLTARESASGYQGALVVAQGGDDPQVQLELSRILSALTGLGADKIRICKGK